MNMNRYALSLGEMGQFPLNWSLQGNQNHQYKNCTTSQRMISAEWSLNCLYSKDTSKNFGSPEYLEISRISANGDILVAGTLSLQLDGSTCLIQRKFSQLIEDGFHTTLIDLDQPKWLSSVSNYTVSNYSFNSVPPVFSMIINLTIPGGSATEKNSNEVNFDSLLVMSSDFERLLDPKVTHFSDLILKCGTVSFSVHKNILSVRSPVFAAMFTTEMKESQENKVNIYDISPSVLKTMLFYIYTSKTGALSVQTAGELLFAGDKYQLRDLKKVCCDYLKSCASVENVLKILVLGYLHDEELKAFAVDFMCKSSVKFEVIEKTPEWKNLLEKIPSLAIDVLTILVKSKDEKLERKN